MKGKDVNRVLENLEELKQKLTREYIETNTSIFREINPYEKEKILGRLDIWLNSWITNRISESIEIVQS